MSVNTMGVRGTLAAALLLVAGVPVVAGAAGGGSAPDREEASKEAWAAAGAAMVRGPARVELRDQAVLEVPDGFGYIPTKEAAALMRLMGNSVDGRFIGLVFPLADEDQYFVSLDYEDSGYIKDDEAREWNADELLQSLKDGTEAANAEREQAGVAPIQVTRWIEPPNYDPAAHRLKWSAEAKLKEGRDDDPTINYNTYVLGREGYITANLITSTRTVATDKEATRPLVESVAFQDGKRYGDFKSGTDKVAAYGLTALVAGVAAKKIGLFAVLAGLVAKFIKIIGAAVVAGVALASRWLKGRSGGASPPGATG